MHANRSKWRQKGRKTYEYDTKNMNRLLTDVHVPLICKWLQQDKSLEGNTHKQFVRFEWCNTSADHAWMQLVTCGVYFSWELNICIKLLLYCTVSGMAVFRECMHEKDKARAKMFKYCHHVLTLIRTSTTLKHCFSMYMRSGVSAASISSWFWPVAQVTLIFN